MDLYPAFAFRRREFRSHPWWGNIIGENRRLSRELLRRIRDEGPLRSLDLDGSGSGSWWGHKPAKKVVAALWSSGELAVRERRNFQRTFDLTERVIPADVRGGSLPVDAALAVLLERALSGHGWARIGTLAQTWRLRNRRPQIDRALAHLQRSDRVTPCELQLDDGRRVPGWIRPDDLELAGRLRRARPREDRPVLLSPFDPVLWDRARVEQLFDFEMVLEIFKPAAKRVFGYYCLPVLAGERLIGRVDLKADRSRGRLRVVRRHVNGERSGDGERVDRAVRRFASALGLELAARASR